MLKVDAAISPIIEGYPVNRPLALGESSDDMRGLAAATEQPVTRL
jgi:hypothetical protein